MLNDYPQLLYIQNWVAKFGYMYRDIQLIRTVMYIAMVLVIGVACFNIVSTLIMAVKDKQGDIAIMRTLGRIMALLTRIFIWYGLLGNERMFDWYRVRCRTCTESHADYSRHRDITR